MKDDCNISQVIAELIRLHDDVLARVFALQTLLQEREVLFDEEVQQRTNELRKRFASDLEARWAKLGKEMDSQIKGRQRILDEYEQLVQ